MLFTWGGNRPVAGVDEKGTQTRGRIACLYDVNHQAAESGDVTKERENGGTSKALGSFFVSLAPRRHRSAPKADVTEFGVRVCGWKGGVRKTTSTAKGKVS